MSYTLEPIGVVHSCFSEKFAIPRQPQLAPAATGILELFPPYNQPEALVGLEHVSHLWLLFIFHAADSGPKHLRVRPPRLGGNQRIGVFASRATHRPNPLGQSVVKLEGIVDGKLLLSGIERLRTDLRGLIEKCLAQDPKPAYQQPEPSREYGGRFWDLNVRWHYPAADCIRVIDIQQVNLPD